MEEFSWHDITCANRDYHDRIARDFDGSLEENHPIVDEFYRIQFARINNFFTSVGKERMRVLDLGCGTGFLEKYVDPRRHSVLGIDISEGMLNQARRKFPEADYRIGDIAQPPEPATYDLVMLNSVLHHLRDPWPVVTAAAAAVAPGGCLFIGNEPNYYAYRYFLALPKWIIRKLPVRHRGSGHDDDLERKAEFHLFFGDGFKASQFAAYLSRAGFARVDTVYSGREMFAGLNQRTGLPIVEYLPRILMDHMGLLARNWCMIAYNRKMGNPA